MESIIGKVIKIHVNANGLAAFQKFRAYTPKIEVFSSQNLMFQLSQNFLNFLNILIFNSLRPSDAYMRW